MSKRRIAIYDTTLRDGAQAEGVSFSSVGKLLLARKLDAFGVDYVEGGFPGSNPKDMAFFEAVRKEEFQHAKIAAFGSTRRVNTAVRDDPIVQGLLGAGMGKGPALALLLAGPALSLPNMLVIRSVMGTKKTVVFVCLVVVMATISGLLFGAFVE